MKWMLTVQLTSKPHEHVYTIILRLLLPWEIRPLTKSKVSFPELCFNILPDKVEDEIRQLNRPLKTYHNRKHGDAELEIEVC